MDILLFSRWLRDVRDGVDELLGDGRTTRSLIRDLTSQLEESMATLQEQLDALTTAVAAGVTELRDEIARLAALPAGEAVDFTNLQAIADNLAGDNIPAAPVEPPPVEPPPVEPPVEP